MINEDHKLTESAFPERGDNSLLILLVGGSPHIEVVQRLERLVLHHENVALEPVWEGLGEFVLGVRASGDSDWGGEYEYATVSANQKGN